MSDATKDVEPAKEPTLADVMSVLQQLVSKMAAEDAPAAADKDAAPEMKDEA
ncbi:hypothetical protein H6A31_14845, partial [Bacteroides mediterraneensis]|nr:hypothetical protein [Bacteroides mediterraneensis]